MSNHLFKKSFNMLLAKLSVQLFLIAVFLSSAIGQVISPEFSVGHGFFESSFQLQITSATTGASIRYTIDGSSPSATIGLAYTGAITISKTSIIRAIAYTTNTTPSAIVTQTYIFLTDVIKQDSIISGYPTDWPANDSTDADYGMDPDVVVGHEVAVKSALKAIPTLSLVTDFSNMFGANGIYLNSTQSGDAWERPVSIELIYADDTEGFQINAGIRSQGGSTRSFSSSPKKSFRLCFRGEYGPTHLNYKLFRNKATDSFDNLVVRAGYNNTWIHANTWNNEDQRKQALYIHDQLVRDIHRSMGDPSASGIFVHLYLNGLYWGIYNLTERHDAAFAASYLGGDKEEYDALNSGDPVDGDTIAWSAMVNIAKGGLSTPSRYSDILQYLDIDNFIDYMILNQYIQNHDWDNHNWYAVRKRITGAGYKFLSWDAEHVAENVNGNSVGILFNGGPTFLFSKLKENIDFKIRFADKVYKHTSVSGALTPTKTLSIFQELADTMYGAVMGESARWGDYRRDVKRRNGPFQLYERDIQWVAERDRLMSTFFPTRTAIVIQQYRTAGLYPKIDPPSLDKLSCNFQDTISVTISNPNTVGKIYFTTDGSDPRIAGGAISSTAQNASSAEALHLSQTTAINTRVLNGNEWSALETANYIRISNYHPLTITEIMYHPPDELNVDRDDFEFIEIKNTGNVQLDLSGIYFSNGLTYVFSVGSTIQPHGFIVLVKDSSRFYIRYLFKPFGVYSGNLNNDGERITLSGPDGNRIFSVQYDIKAPWPTISDSGYSLVPVDPNTNTDPDNANNWRFSTNIFGSPGFDDGTNTDITINPIRVPSVFQLLQNYPNPFNPTTVISYELPVISHVSLKVYDVLGREVAALVDDTKKAGYYNATFDASHLSSSIYFSRLVAQSIDGKSFVKTIKLLMTK
jgi:hypothetical protein